MHTEIEKSIITTYRKEIWSKFSKAVRDYKLINSGDKIMACISGGKDSFLMAKCLQELALHGEVEFEVKYVVMNPGYTIENLNKIKENAKILNLDIEIFDTNIFDVVVTTPKSPCYLCARMRRGYLYNHAKELGCNKIALGHHYDDVIETTLLSMLYGAEVKTMLPKLKSDNYLGLELIRPMYLVKEENIIRWANHNNLKFLNCACKFTLENDKENSSKRKEVKELIRVLKENNNEVEHNIFKSMQNINLNCVLGYSKDGEKHFFQDEY